MRGCSRDVELEGVIGRVERGDQPPWPLLTGAHLQTGRLVLTVEVNRPNAEGAVF